MRSPNFTRRFRGGGKHIVAAVLTVSAVCLCGCESPGSGVTLSPKVAQPETVSFPPPVARPYFSQEAAKTERGGDEPGAAARGVLVALPASALGAA